MRGKLPKLATLMDTAEENVLAYPPNEIVAPDAAPDRQLLAWAVRNGVALDWLLRGDVRSTIRAQRSRL